MINYGGSIQYDPGVRVGGVGCGVGVGVCGVVVVGGHLLCGPYPGFAHKGLFLSPISVAKGLFLVRFPLPNILFWLRLRSQG